MPEHSLTIPACEGRPFRVEAGKRFRIVTPKGAQAADFFAYSAAEMAEWLSPPHSWVTTFCVKPRVGDTLVSRFRRPMLTLVEDRAEGCHDMMIAACDQFRYEFFGHEGPHASCAENLMTSMRRMGHQIGVVPQPVNFFTNTAIEADGKLVALPNPVPPGASVTLEAAMDLICVVSSCPFDLELDGWSINAAGGPTELLVELL